MANHKSREMKTLLDRKDAEIARLCGDKARLSGSLEEARAEIKRLTGFMASHGLAFQEPMRPANEASIKDDGSISKPSLSADRPAPSRSNSQPKIPPAGSPKHSVTGNTTTDELNTLIAPAIITNPGNLMFRGFHITDEQQNGLSMALSGQDLKIEAGAGSGKTTQLAAISSEFSSGKLGYKKGLYLAFNRSAVLDARKRFHPNTKCMTPHGAAFATVGCHYQDRGRLNGRLTPSVVVQALKLLDYKHITAYTVGALLIGWISKYCQSSDREITVDNAPWEFLKTLTLEGDKRIAYEIAKTYAQELRPLAVHLWRMLSDYKSSIPITPDVYLKVWALGKPRLPYSYILFDEAQDAAPVMLGVVQAQQAQKIWVGDRRQQIYAWRGAVNAMDHIQTENNTTLTRSFRYGQPIAELANCVLRNFLNEKDFALAGSSNVRSQIRHVANPSAYICRTNRSAVAELMRAMSKSKSVHIEGGVQELLYEIESADALMQGRRPRSPAFQVFQDWNAMIEYSESPAGSDLKPLIKMIDQWGIPNLQQALGYASGIRQESADLTISTVHKIKGREYDTVRLADDFVFPSTDKHECRVRFSDEEAHLLYVAITRAKHDLDITNCTAAEAAMIKRPEKR